MSRATWNVWKGKFPDLKKYQMLSLDPMPIKKLLAWAPKGKTVSVYDRRCRRIRVSRVEGALMGRRATGRSVLGKTMTVTHDGYAFGTSIMLTDGGTDSYRRKGKKWIMTGGKAHGCARSVGYMLSRVTATAAYYDAALVKLYVVCGSTQQRVQHCRKGGTRRCRWCHSWSIGVRSLMASVGYGRYGSPVITVEVVGKPKTVDCRKPCPRKAKSQAVKDLARFLKGRSFLHLRSDSEHPYVFRSRRACRRYRKRKKISSVDLNVW